MTQVVVIRRRTIPRNRSYITAGVALVMLLAAGINLGIGYTPKCYNYYSYHYYCTYNTALIISGYCFLVSGVFFLIFAIALEVQIRRALRNPSTTIQQPVTLASGYPTQVVTTYPTVPTQYPPPYSPPTGVTPFPVSHSENQAPPTGFTPYPMSPYANQAPPTAGVAAASEPTQQYSKDVAQPPAYAP